MFKMIWTALYEAHVDGRVGLEPREIYDAILAKGWGPIKLDYVRTRTWRLMNEKRIAKVGDTAMYALLEKDKPVGATSVEDTPTGLFSNPAQSREAGSGGGT